MPTAAHTMCVSALNVKYASKPESISARHPFQMLYLLDLRLLLYKACCALPAETSHLIGQWLPVDPASSSAALQPSVMLALQQVVKLATCQCILSLQQSPGLPSIAQQLGSLLSSLPSSWFGASGSQGTSDMLQWSEAVSTTVASGSQMLLLPDAQLQSVLQAARTLLLLLAEEQHLMPAHVQAAVFSLTRRLVQLQQEFDGNKAHQGMAFAWVESLLVTAVREGHWVRTFMQSKRGFVSLARNVFTCCHVTNSIALLLLAHTLQ